MNKKKVGNKVPRGVTCHYERDFDGRWWVVWGADFAQDEPGRKLVSKKDSLCLEMGYEIGKIEGKMQKFQSNMCGDWK